MTRLTITLTEERHQALKEAALRQGKTIGQVIEESLDLAGVKTARRAADIVAAARNRAGLSDQEALELAVAETRAARQR